MFYHLNLEKEIELHPRYFGPRLSETLEQKLLAEVDAFSLRSYTYAVLLTLICKH
jgi:DNA-directed RNA polymerase II subunit RPB7